jgi:hypothetical protein
MLIGDALPNWLLPLLPPALPIKLLCCATNGCDPSAVVLGEPGLPDAPRDCPASPLYVPLPKPCLMPGGVPGLLVLLLFSYETHVVVLHLGLLNSSSCISFSSASAGLNRGGVLAAGKAQSSK